MSTPSHSQKTSPGHQIQQTKTQERLRLNTYFWLVIVAWSVVILLSVGWNIYRLGATAFEVARIQARAEISQDILYRRWSAGHGGVYVPITPDTPPNPYLADIENRDIETLSGIQLTLVNPAYMTRQVHELPRTGSSVLGHITSLDPIRPQNAADEWETVALQAFEAGAEEWSGLSEIDGQTYMRLMQPLTTEEGCLQCHGDQGYEVGDVRGGLSIAVPMAPFWETSLQSLIGMIGGHLAIWLLGVVGAVFSRRQLNRTSLELDKAQLQLLDAKLAAEAGTKAKSAFLATVSHEIRTPMNGVIGMTDLLLGTPLTAEQRNFADTIRVSGENLLTIINDILDFSKIESGNMDLEHVAFSLLAVVGDTMELLAPRANEKELALVYDVGTDVPTAVYGDSTRLRQVLTNLLGNGIKFTETGEVGLRITAVPDEPDRLQFTVYDTGIGIAADKMETIFTPFTQADTSVTRKYGGTGLGLAIINQLVALMGGAIRVESDPGQGSRFVFTIDAPAAPVETDTDDHGRCLLVVTAHPANRRTLRTLARHFGFAIDAAASGRETVALLENGRDFDLILIDQDLPEMSGVALAQNLRKRPAHAAMPMLLLTAGWRRHEDLPPDLFAAVLTKPIHTKTLQTALGKSLLDDQPAKASPSPAEPEMADMAADFPLRILVAEDNLINQKLILKMLNKIGYEAALAVNGRDALAMQAASPFDLILMDMQMPEMDGISATRQLVADYGTAERPIIIAMTANAQASDREMCLAAGMDDYLSKPVRLDVLKTALYRWAQEIKIRRDSLLLRTADII